MFEWESQRFMQLSRYSEKMSKNTIVSAVYSWAILLKGGLLAYFI